MIAAVPGSEYQKACEWIYLSGLKTLLCRQNLKKEKKNNWNNLSPCAIKWSLFGHAFNTQHDSHKTHRYAHWVMLPLKAGQNFTTANVTWTCNRPLNVHWRWLEEIVYNAHHCASVCNRQTGYVWTFTGHCRTLKQVKGVTPRLNASKCKKRKKRMWVSTQNKEVCLL